MNSLRKLPMCTEKNNILQTHKRLKKSGVTQISGSQENVLVFTQQNSVADSNSVNKDVAEMLWFAMSATFGREMKVKEFLDKNNVRCFVPLRYQLVNMRGKGKVRKLVPAISNLIFVNTTRDNILEWYLMSWKHIIVI